MEPIIFERKEMERLFGFGVYLIRNETEILYIGRSRSGLHRPFQPNHIPAMKALLEYTHLEFLPCRNEEEANRVEIKMIREHRPKYNLACNPDKMIRKTPRTKEQPKTIHYVDNDGFKRTRRYFGSAGKKIGDVKPDPAEILKAQFFARLRDEL